MRLSIALLKRYRKTRLDKILTYHPSRISMRRRMGFRITLLILIILVSGCATTTTESVSTTPPESVGSGADPQHHAGVSGQHPLSTDSGTALKQDYTDLWQRIRDGFQLPSLSNKYVDYYRKWYAARPEYIARLSDRAQPYLFYILEEIEKRGMPTEIALLPAIESAYKPTAYSRAHASGLWQFIPSTAKRYGLKRTWWYDGRRDVIESTRAALDYLEFLHKEFNGDWFHALAAYNAGEGRIKYAIRKNKSRGNTTHFQHLRLKSETRRYVPKLIAFKEIVDHPEKFGIDLKVIDNGPFFAAVDTRGQIDLHVVQDLSGMSTKELKHLNAAFNRWATDPDGPHRVLVPVSKSADVETGIAALPISARLKWGHYRIKPGDTLSQIARKYGVSVQALQRSNKLNGTFIRAGKDLLIPLSSGSLHYAANTFSAGGNPVVHRVRSGDTLWGIARRYNVYVKQLARWNSIRTNDLLHLGQNIVVYMN